LQGIPWGEGNEPKLIPYTLDDVAASTKRRCCQRLEEVSAGAREITWAGSALGGLEKSGWRVTFSSTMNEHQKAGGSGGAHRGRRIRAGIFCALSGSDNADEFAEVVWGSPAAKAG